MSCARIVNENPILHDERTQDACVCVLGAREHATQVYVCLCVCWRVHVTVRECTRGYKVLRLLYGGRGMWVRKPALLTSDSIRVS